MDPHRRRSERRRRSDSPASVAGNIHVVVSDTNKQVQLYKQQMEQLQQKLQLQLRMMQQSQQMIENSP